MANEHFFPGDYFSPAPFIGASYAPVPLPRSGLEAAAMAFGLPWADQQLPAADSTAHFDSALSSLVSSPAGGGEDDVSIGDLIGRLGSICNGASTNNSCYSTPLSSPSRGPFRGYGALESGGRLSRVSSSKSLGGNNASAAAAAAAAEADTGPKTAGHAAMPDPPPTTKGSARKRKAAPAKGKAKAEPSPSLPAVRPICLRLFISVISASINLMFMYAKQLQCRRLRSMRAPRSGRGWPTAATSKTPRRR
jgi:hypothetical protein